jgi:UDP-2,3-diacylglucosamine hydrolase
VLTAPCYVIADTHIGVASTDVDRAVLAWLEARLAEARRGETLSLLINGDLFEFWFEWRTVIPRPAFRVLAALAALHDAGVPILWIAGNHDCWGGDVIRRDVGAVYHVGPWVGSIAGWRVRVEHGDGLRQREDRRYRALRVLLRNRLAIRAFRWVPADLATRLAFWSSHTSRTTRARDGGAGLRRVALGYLEAADAPELVLLGHSHVETLERAPGGGIYANAGSWLADPMFLRIMPERIELRRWDGTADGAVVKTLDRPARADARDLRPPDAHQLTDIP